MRGRAWAIGIMATFFACNLPKSSVDGHLYLMEPTSRNFYYTTAFQSTDFEDVNYCPHCYQCRGPAAVAARAAELTPPEVLADYGDGAWPHLTAYNRGELASNGNFLESDEIAVRHGICGDPEQTKAEGSNVFGRENSIYPVLQTYEEGSIIELKVAVSTYHWGHLEYFICNSDDLPDPEGGPVTQSCFNMHPLDRADDDGGASPIDPDHPGRYYVDPPCRADETDQTMPEGAYEGYVVTGRYKLPEGLVCNRCILQMIHYTGHLCKLPGYETFTPDSLPQGGEGCAQATEDWINLDPPTCGEGAAYPEEFFNCSDIEIVLSGGAPASSSSSGDSESEPTSPPSNPQDGSGGTSSSSSSTTTTTSSSTSSSTSISSSTISTSSTSSNSNSNSNSLSCQPTEVLPTWITASNSTQSINPAYNIVDGSLETRWSAQGSASWIAIDLPVAVSLSAVELAFEDGDERTQDFEIVVITDNQVSTTFHTSSGDTNDFQRFSSFADGGALMVTTVVLVGYGNSLNDWNSFTEIKLCKGDVASA